MASRLAEKYGCPTFMVCLDQGVGKGSCRSWGRDQPIPASGPVRRSAGGLWGPCPGCRLHRAGGERIPELSAQLQPLVLEERQGRNWPQCWRRTRRCYPGAHGWRRWSSWTGWSPAAPRNPQTGAGLTGAHVLSAAQGGPGPRSEAAAGGQRGPAGRHFSSPPTAENWPDRLLPGGCGLLSPDQRVPGLRSVQLQVVDLPGHDSPSWSSLFMKKYRRGDLLTPLEAQSPPTRAEFVCLWRYLKRQSAGQPIPPGHSPRIARGAARSRRAAGAAPTHTWGVPGGDGGAGGCSRWSGSPSSLEITLHQLEQAQGGSWNASGDPREPAAEGHAGGLGARRGKRKWCHYPARSNSSFQFLIREKVIEWIRFLERYQALEDKVAAYTPNLDTKRLFDAFTCADAEHHGQLRRRARVSYHPSPGSGRHCGRSGAGCGLGHCRPAPRLHRRYRRHP